MSLESICFIKCHDYYADTKYDSTFADVITKTCLRAAYDDANECVFISARSLHGGIKASGEIQLRVLSTPDYKTHTERQQVLLQELISDVTSHSS